MTSASSKRLEDALATIGVASPQGADYRRLTLILGALTAMGPLAMDMYLPSFPTMAREFLTDTASVQVSLAAYFAGIAIGQAFYGPLSDAIGRKPVLYLGLTVFILASIGCAFAEDVTSFVALRFVQALGGCAPLVVPRAVVRDYFDQLGSIKMLSMLMLVMGLAPILAPLIGGQLLVNFGWRSVFWVLTAYAIVWLILVALFLPESLPLTRRRRQAVGTVLATYGRLMTDRTYIGYVLSGALIFAGLLAYITGSPLVFIDIFNVPPERYGLIFGTNAIGIMTASQINRWLATRVEARRTVRTMLSAAMLASLVLLADAYTGFGGFLGILVPLFCFISCHGFVMPNTTALAMAPHGHVAGSASALLGTIQFVLGATTGALVGIFANGSAVPLAAVIAGCGVAAFLTNRLVSS